MKKSVKAMLLVLAVLVFGVMAIASTSESDTNEGTKKEGADTAQQGNNNDDGGSSKEGTRTNPIAVGTTVTFNGMSTIFDTYKVELTVTEVSRGDDAWKKVKAGNQFNSEAGEGKEYMLVKFKIKALESKDDEKITISNSSFNFVSSAGVKYEDFTVVSGVKPELSDMYSGAEMEGYAYQLVDKDDEPLVVFLERNNNGIWFKTK